MSAVLGWLGLTWLMFWLSRQNEKEKEGQNNQPFQIILKEAMQTFFWYSGLACMFGLIMGIVLEYRCADIIASGSGIACMSAGINWATQYLWFPALIFLFGVLFLIIEVYRNWESIRQKNF